MAKQVATNGLAGKLGNKLDQAVEAHKNDEVKLPGGGSLPEGIENGIARLVDCRFSQYKEGDNKGEWFFLAAGVMVEPKYLGNIPIEGMRTQIMEPIMETPNRSRKTVEEHIAWVMNEMRKLGMDTTNLSGDQLEAAAEALKEAQPYFMLRTWKGEATEQFPNPRVNETWVKAIDNYEPKVSDDVVDNSGPSQYAPKDETKPAPATKPATTTAKAATKPKAAPATAPKVEEPSLAQLGEDADGGDVEAATKLAELAKPLGVDTDAYATWTEVAELLMAQGEGDDGSSDDGSAATGAGDVQPPKVGEVYYYVPEGEDKPVEVEVTAVFDGKKAANIRNLTTKELYRGKPWTELQDSP
jgi:hypothetical protein